MNWRISDWIKRRLMECGIDVEPFHRGLPPRPTAWLEFNQLRFTPTAHRVELLHNGRLIASLERLPEPEDGDSLTIDGGFVGYTSLTVEWPP